MGRSASTYIALHVALNKRTVLLHAIEASPLLLTDMRSLTLKVKCITIGLFCPYDNGTHNSCMYNFSPVGKLRVNLC